MKERIGIILICMLVITSTMPIVTSINNIDSSIKSLNYIHASSADTWKEIQKILASDGEEYDGFGGSVSISGDTALISASSDDDNGWDSGSAYVFTRTGATWTEQAKLLASDGEPNNFFGSSVSISGDTALIGAPDKDYGRRPGSAYVFTRTGATWTEQAKLLASDREEYDDFGRSVFISGDYALIGAPGDDTEYGNGSGSVYVFTRTGKGWIQQQKLIASDAEKADQFGWSVSISGDTALIGGGTWCGKVYVFTRTGTTWTEQAKLLASDGEIRKEFGISVSISSDTALIGAPSDDTEYGNKAGSAYVFTRTGSTWTEQAKLLASDGEKWNYFGWSVSISGDTAFIGAPYNGCCGSTYVFTLSNNTWAEQAKLLASDEEEWGNFGWSVFISGDTAFIGAPANGCCGSTYVFTSIKNTPPEKPTITGQSKGKPGIEYEYTFVSSDPEEDQISYYIDWGDNTNTGWTESSPSGKNFDSSHIWIEKGFYSIKAKAKDIYGFESDWADPLVVSMPKSKATENILFCWFFEKLLQHFSFFEKILNQIIL